MSLIETTSTDLAADDARELTDRIRFAVEATWQLIATAYTQRAWSALGYATWDDYCTREFGGSRLRLPREERGEVVASLREQGLSIRAIAAATGIDRNTVRSDLAQVGEFHPPADPTDPDGGYVDDEGYAPGDNPADYEDDFDDFGPPIAAEPVVIIGTDGKSYPVTPRPAVTAEEQRERDEEAARGRDLRRLQMFCSSFHQFVAVATNQYGTRELLLARLVPSDLQIILDAETRFTWNS